jgi:hypothetical protein
MRRLRLTCVRWLVAGLFAVMATASNIEGQNSSNRAGLIAGFVPIDDARPFWVGSWVFARTATTERVMPRFFTTDQQFGDGPLPNKPLRLRLDDGLFGTMQVEAGPCAGDECEPDDCGCLNDDGFWINVTDSAGRRVAHFHLWAAYGRFDVVPVDLIDGPGDELIIVRIPRHSVPKQGLDLKIWKLGSVKPMELVERIKVADSLDYVTGAEPCAVWKTRLIVGVAEHKPRSITLRPEFRYSDWPDGGCQLSQDGLDRVAALKRDAVLRFQGGRYSVTYRRK